MASDKLVAMKVFRRVAELGSFTKAADDLDVTSATVSKHIAYLEQDLDVRLINRTTRRMHLTDAGEQFLSRTQFLLDELEDAERSLKGVVSAPSGKLRVNAPMSFGLTAMSEAVDRFLSLYPDIELDLQLTDRVIDLVEQGVDLAIRVRDKLPDSSLVARRIKTARSVLCASPDYLERAQTIERVQDLRAHNCIMFSLHERPNVWRLGDEDVEVQGNLRVDSSMMIRESLLLGQGISLVPRFVVNHDLEAGRLVQVLKEQAPAPYQIFAVFPPGRKQPRKVRLFVEHLEQYLSKQDYGG